MTCPHVIRGTTIVHELCLAGTMSMDQEYRYISRFTRFCAVYTVWEINGRHVAIGDSNL